MQRPGNGPLAVISWARPDEDPGALTAELHIVDPGTGAVHDLGPASLGAHVPAWWDSADSWHLAYLATTPPGTVGGLAVLEALRLVAGALVLRDGSSGVSGQPTMVPPWLIMAPP